MENNKKELIEDIINKTIESEKKEEVKQDDIKEEEDDDNELDNDDLFDDMDDIDNPDKKINIESINSEINKVDTLIENNNDEEITKNENKQNTTSDDEDEERLNERVLVILNSPNYPIDEFPSFTEIKKIIKEKRELFFVEIGGIVDKISFGTDIKCFLHTTLKSKDMIEFNKLDISDENEKIDKFNNFIIERCLIAPKIKDIESLSAGEYFVLIQHIKSKSYLNNADVSIIKI